jgi:hypothetical protein
VRGIDEEVFIEGVKAGASKFLEIAQAISFKE